MARKSRARKRKSGPSWQYGGLAVLAVAAGAAVYFAVFAPVPAAPPVSDKVAAAYASPSPVPTFVRTQVTVIGDSYVAGSDMGGLTTTNWVPIALKDVGAVDLIRKGVGGSGYVERGPKDTILGDVVAPSVGPKTDLIVFFGSINDRGASPEQVGAAAAAAYAQANASAPTAKLLVIGPAWTNAKVPAAIIANTEALRTAAEVAGATWVDPIAEGWFFDQPALIGADKTHPTDEGHAYMAKLIYPRIAAALGKP